MFKDNPFLPKGSVTRRWTSEEAAEEAFTKVFDEAYERAWKALTDAQRRHILASQEYLIQSKVDEEGCSIVFTPLKVAIWNEETLIPRQAR